VATASNQPARGSALTNGTSKNGSYRPDMKGKAQTPFNNSSNCGPDQEWDPMTKQCVPKKPHNRPPPPQGPGFTR